MYRCIGYMLNLDFKNIIQSIFILMYGRLAEKDVVAPTIDNNIIFPFNSNVQEALPGGSSPDPTIDKKIHLFHFHINVREALEPPSSSPGDSRIAPTIPKILYSSQLSTFNYIPKLLPCFLVVITWRNNYIHPNII